MKQNLVLIHSFGTNSIILKGFIDFLKDYFKVYFIDLPGLYNKVEPLKEVTLNNYSEFVQEKINKLRLRNYWLGGISFGFLVANGVIDKRCKGFIALEPYISVEEFNLFRFDKPAINLLINMALLTKTNNIIWRSGFFRNFLIKSAGFPDEYINLMLSTIDPRTFFETARLILKSHDFNFQQKPHVLIVNEKDKAIDVKEITGEFKDKIDNLLVIKTKAIHYPHNISKDYFRKIVKKDDMNMILRFMGKYT